MVVNIIYSLTNSQRISVCSNQFKALANEGGDRSTTIVFKTTDGKKNYSAETSISQKGAIVEASIADFLAAEVGETQYPPIRCCYTDCRH
jgi:K+-transporting ATPase A subunit